MLPVMPFWVEHAWRDSRYALRLIASQPGVAAIAVLSIALGTGANVAMFSGADALVMRPLPIARAGEVITIGTPLNQGLTAISLASYPDYRDILARSRSFSAIAAFTSQRAGLRIRRDDLATVKIVTSVNATFFDDLGIAIARGRAFRADEDDVAGRDAVAVLSDRAWRDLYDGDPAVVGRPIFIAGQAFTVVGVADSAFTGMDGIAASQVYVPLAMWPQVLNVPGPNPLDARDRRELTLKALLEPGVRIADAQRELAAIAADLERMHPATNTGQTLIAQTELQFRASRGPIVMGLVILLSVLSVTVLLVACANVSALLMSRAPQRARELAMRLAIGAARGRLIQQLLTESVVIALVGAVAGLAVGYAGIVLVGQIEFPTDIMALPPIRLDTRALAFSLAAALGSALLFGLGPALATTRLDLSSSLRSSERTTRRPWRLGSRGVLVAVQVSLSLVLLAVATISIQTFNSAFDRGPGFRTSGLAKLSVDHGQSRYEGATAVHFIEEMVAAARRIPAVASAGVTSAMPLWGLEILPLMPDGIRAAPGRGATRVYSAVVDEGYFETMAIPIVGGRGFGVTDRAHAALVAIVNETAARRHWPDRDAVGRRFRTVEGGPEIEIVGVAKDSTYLYAAEPPQDMVYLPFRQWPRTHVVLLAATRGPSADVLKPMQDVVRAIDASVPVYDAQTIEGFYEAIATRIGRVALWMVAGLGVMGVVISVIGLYGVVSYSVSRRTREIGIRIAVGATYSRVIRLVLRQGLAPVWTGLAAGLVASFAVARWLPSFAPFSQVYDARAILALVPLMLAATMVAAFVPARRAATILPTQALRQD
jgi:predicted permease